ncbi:hypothetical protein NQ315_015165 [Exocentrus adspersus]|uniref:Uncharacterized protein n=1 Tax=Exocentrus adspersus TaxID=1586481 RepID=A0AAV8V4V8_9CUCU|nr:hypothetical protein NQ315_015165 [Exocentrus adspersus]
MTQLNGSITLFSGPVIWRFVFNLNSHSNIQTIETKHANSIEFYLLLANLICILNLTLIWIGIWNSLDLLDTGSTG